MRIHYFDDNFVPDDAGLNWRALRTAELGTASVVVNNAWVRWRAAWGNSTFKIVAWDAANPIGEAPAGGDFWQLPPNTRSFTAEGRRDSADTLIAVDLLQQAK